MTKFSPELLQKIKDSVNIIEVIGEQVVLRKSGANYTGLCPFHSERTPSFSVSENKQLYHCYGCKKGGDLVTFVREIQGVSFLEAIEDLAERGRVALPKEWVGTGENPERDKKQSEQRAKQALAYKLNRFAAAFFHQSLGNSPSAIGYYLNRGVSEEWAKAFYLGAVSDSWDSLARHLVARKAPLDMAVELGLIRQSTKNIPSEGSPGYFDLFRNRALFPILNMRGKVSGFGGRSLGQDTPKYLNSPESLVFQKGKLAYGLYQAQKHIRERDEIILVEGYFDVLAMHAAGFQNVVATCGTALTPDHLAIFKRLASKVIVLFDGDQAGVTATERAMEIGLDSGIVIYGAQMPNELDPDELVLDSAGRVSKEGQDQMAELLKNSKPLLDEKIAEQVRSARESPEARTQGLKKIGIWLARFQDPVGRQVRLELIQKQMGTSSQLLQKALGKLPSSETATVKVAEVSVETAKTKKSRDISNSTMGPMDRILLSGLAFGGDYSRVFAEARANLPPKITLSALFEYGPAREFVEKLFSQAGLMERLRSTPESLFNEDLDSQVISTLTEALLSTGPPIAIDAFRGSLQKSQGKLWARFSQDIRKALAEAEIREDSTLQDQLMKEYLDVQRKMKEFSNFYDEE